MSDFRAAIELADGEPPVPNMTLLRKVVKWAKTEAEKPPETCAWDQSGWRRPSPHNCHTTYCIAGYAAEVSKAKWASDDPDSTWYDYLLAEPDDPPYNKYVDNDGQQIVTVAIRAQRLLGLTSHEADRLFNGNLDLPEVIERAKVIADRAGKRLL